MTTHGAFAAARPSTPPCQASVLLSTTPFASDLRPPAQRRVAALVCVCVCVCVCVRALVGVAYKHNLR